MIIYVLGVVHIGALVRTSRKFEARNLRQTLAMTDCNLVCACAAGILVLLDVHATATRKIFVRIPRQICTLWQIEFDFCKCDIYLHARIDVFDVTHHVHCISICQPSVWMLVISDASQKEESYHDTAHTRDEQHTPGAIRCDLRALSDMRWAVPARAFLRSTVTNARS